MIVAGGGLLGLEAAGGAARLGAEASVVHSGSWLMSAQLDEGAGRGLGRIIGGQGIGLHLGTRPRSILVDEQGGVSGVTFSSGQQVDVDIVVFAIGIRARDELARDAGIELGDRGGVVIGTDCRTSAPGVWAIGEVACFDGRCTG
ncbi:FAD-dependent oxidoreductase, partial [Clavibacter michiganensis]|uniref:FAD-dependent oxidoreductase n=1 Tax=Clavibacter michiganensis TaxID=28447 RepID=UPI00292D2CE2